MSLDIGKAFTFVFEDPKWLNKVLIGGLLILGAILASFTIIGGILVGAILLGYCVQLTRNVIAGAATPLPEWSNIGAFFSDGLRAIVVLLALSAPIILVYLVLFLPGQIISSVSDSGGAAGLGLLLILAGSCLLLPLGILSGVLMPIALARYATTNNIGSALQFGELFATLRANVGTYIIVWLLSSVAGGIIGQLGIILCGVGLLFTSFYASLMTYHLYGQAERIRLGAQSGGGYGQPYGQARPF